jgi:glycosyltransferase involved in cell wall biosynthesis
MYSKYIRNKKAVIKINNAINIQKYTYNKNVRDKKRTENNFEDCFVIGHIGSFTYVKNHTFLLKFFMEILKKRENAILFLIGDGPLFSEIKKEACELGLADKVIFHGLTLEVNAYMQMFDVFVLPSWFEGMPLTGIEAQCAGLPCVFSDNVTREVDLTGNCQFLSLQDNPSVWAEKIIALTSFQRKDNSGMVQEHGFDIQDSALKLKNVFVQAYSRI